MTREAIGIGDTEELAKSDALKQLGLSSSDGVEFEVIKKAEKKKFGIFGGSPAKVKAIVNTPDEIEEVIEEIQKSEIQKNIEEIETEAEKSIEEININIVETVENIDKNINENIENSNTEKAVVDYECAKEAKEYVERVLKAMELNDIEVSMTENDNSAEITLSGEQVGSVIGRRGETLDALQYLAGLVANHVGNSYFRITINTGNYREKREKTLEGLGRKLAFKVLKTGRNVSLEPMNPYERRIIHTAVQKINGAISWSEGEVTNRHVVIGPDPEYKRNYRKSNYNKGGRKHYNNSYDRKKTYNSQRKNNTSDSVKVEREPKNEGENFSLYGRVDTKNN